MEIKKKILLMLTLFLVLTSVFIPFSFGADNKVITFHDEEYNKDVNVTLPYDFDDDYYCFSTQSVYWTSYGRYTIYLYSSSDPIYTDGNGIVKSNSSVCRILGYVDFRKGDEDINISLDYSNVEVFPADVGINCGFNTLTKVVYSSYDIKNYLSGEVVFQVAPQDQGQTLKLAPLMNQSINYSMVMEEILTILPIILVVVIGLLALMKAIKLLLQMLQVI